MRSPAAHHPASLRPPLPVGDLPREGRVAAVGGHPRVGLCPQVGDGALLCGVVLLQRERRLERESAVGVNGSDCREREGKSRTRTAGSVPRRADGRSQTPGGSAMAARKNESRITNTRERRNTEAPALTRVDAMTALVAASYFSNAVPSPKPRKACAWREERWEPCSEAMEERPGPGIQRHIDLSRGQRRSVKFNCAAAPGGIGARLRHPSKGGPHLTGPAVALKPTVSAAMPAKMASRLVRASWRR